MARCKSQALLFAPVLVLCLAAGCGKRGTPPDGPTGTVLPVPAATEDGWPLYEVKAEGFALALPPDWRQFDMNPATFEAKFQESLRQNPELEAMLGSLRQQVAAGIKFFGVDQATMGTGFATNVNVLRVPVPPGGTLDQVVTETVRQLESLPAVTKPVKHERLKLPTGERERIHCKMTMQMPTGARQLAITQFVLVKGSNGYAVTLTTLPDQEAKYAATFDKIGRSFRLTK